MLIYCFVEDDGHRIIVGRILRRLAERENVAPAIRFLNAYGGRSRVLSAIKLAFEDIAKGVLERPDVLVIAIDGNCSGPAEVKKRIEDIEGFEGFNVALAIPDPHVERWLLIGSGCAPPDQKCEKSRYKSALSNAVRAAGVNPLLGGLEHGETIIDNLDLERALTSDQSLGAFISSMRGALKRAAIGR
jgi:hypothetical protein